VRLSFGFHEFMIMRLDLVRVLFGYGLGKHEG
jgi:hypothetical protein